MELAEADGGVEIRPAPAEIELVEVDGRLVARADGLPALTDEIARETIERVRRRRRQTPAWSSLRWPLHESGISGGTAYDALSASPPPAATPFC